MALPRVYSFGRAFASRGAIRVCNTAFLSSRITNVSRPFMSTSNLKDATVQDGSMASSSSPSPISPGPIPEEQRRKNAASVKLMKVPRDVVPEQVESLFKGVGLDVVDMQMDLDRFRFLGNTYVSVQLADEKQAQKAVEVLQGNDTLGGQIYIAAMKPDFDWNRAKRNPYDFQVNWDEAGMRSAVQPLLDGRRVRISVQSPGWGNKRDKPAQKEAKSMEVLVQTFKEFGIESIGHRTPQFGHISYHPKFYCHIDFTTKEGAEAARQAVHDTEIEGKRVWAVRTRVDAAKAYQIGRLSPALLQELQEKELAPPENKIDKKVHSWRTKKDDLKFDRERNKRAANGGDYLS